MIIEYRGEVRYASERWQPAGRFESYPSLAELRSAAWNVAASRPRGTALPVEVRVVTIQEEPGSAFPFENDGDAV